MWPYIQHYCLLLLLTKERLVICQVYEEWDKYSRIISFNTNKWYFVIHCLLHLNAKLQQCIYPFTKFKWNGICSQQIINQKSLNTKCATNRYTLYKYQWMYASSKKVYFKTDFSKWNNILLINLRKEEIGNLYRYCGFAWELEYIYISQ